MTKEHILKSILSTLECLKLDIYTKCKNENWNADIVIKYDTYKVAFNICKRPHNVEETYKAMRNERVCGCWLLMPTKNSVFLPNYMPCFKLSENSNKIEVFLNSEFNNDSSNIITLDDFIQDLIKGNIRFAKKMLVKYIEVCFLNMTCWKCHKLNQVYFIKRLLSQDGISVTYNSFLHNELEFNPLIINSIEQYIKTHPELKIKMGEIKSRYSKTVNGAYTSFGCAYCDSIFGNHFVHENIMEIKYNSNYLPKAMIEIKDAFITTADCWYKKNIFKI